MGHSISSQEVRSEDGSALIASTWRKRPAATLRPCPTCETTRVLVEIRYPDEVEIPIVLWEGARRPVWVNTAERNEQARRQCLAHYGARCSVCGFDFGAVYGEFGKIYARPSPHATGDDTLCANIR